MAAYRKDFLQGQIADDHCTVVGPPNKIECPSLILLSLLAKDQAAVEGKKILGKKIV